MLPARYGLSTEAVRRGSVAPGWQRWKRTGLRWRHSALRRIMDGRAAWATTGSESPRPTCPGRRGGARLFYQAWSGTNRPVAQELCV